jgi:hypothetical protein
LPAVAGNAFARTVKPPNQYSRARLAASFRIGRRPDFQPRCVNTHHSSLSFTTIGETCTAATADTSDPSEKSGVFCKNARKFGKKCAQVTLRRKRIVRREPPGIWAVYRGPRIFLPLFAMDRTMPLHEILAAKSNSDCLLLTLTTTDVAIAQKAAPNGVTVRPAWEWLLEEAGG